MLHLLIPGAALYGDRKLKKIARQGNELVPPFEKHVKWYHVENRGLACSKLKDKPKAVLLIQTVSTVLLSVILLFDWGEKSFAEKTGSDFILFGALSNLYDRLVRGTVTDMFRFPRAPGKLKKLIFNLADFMLFLGVILTALGRIFRRK